VIARGTSPSARTATIRKASASAREEPQFPRVKVWDRREFKDLDGNVELGIRKSRSRCGACANSPHRAPDELDLDTTIKETANTVISTCICARSGATAVKVLVFFDIGGSMDSHIEQVEELFSAARTEFKHMEYFYFHTVSMKACGSRTAAFHRPHADLGLLHKYRTTTR